MMYLYLKFYFKKTEKQLKVVFVTAIMKERGGKKMKFEEQSLRIPRLSVKGSFLVFVSLVFGGIIFPYLLMLVGMSFKTGVMLTLPISLAFSLLYNHYFIETKQGFCKRFIIFLVVVTALLELLAYFWIVKGLFLK